MTFDINNILYRLLGIGISSEDPEVLLPPEYKCFQVAQGQNATVSFLIVSPPLQPNQSYVLRYPGGTGTPPVETPLNPVTGFTTIFFAPDIPFKLPNGESQLYYSVTVFKKTPPSTMIPVITRTIRVAQDCSVGNAEFSLLALGTSLLAPKPAAGKPAAGKPAVTRSGPKKK